MSGYYEHRKVRQAFNASKENHVDIDGFVSQIFEARRRNDHQQASALWRNACHNFPPNKTLWAAIGRVFEKCGDHELSIEAHGKAHHLAPDDLDLALAYAGRMKYKDFQAAEETLLRQLGNQRNLKSAPLFYCLGKTYGIAGHVDMAVTCLKHAVRINPENAKYGKILETYERLGGRQTQQSADTIAARMNCVLNSGAAPPISSSNIAVAPRIEP